MTHRFYEIEVQFLDTARASIPVTAESEEKAREIAMELFSDKEGLQIAAVTDIGTPGKPAQNNPLMN